MPSSAASVSLSGRSARCSGWRRRRPDEVGAAADDPRLRAAEELVARERDEVGAGRDAVASRAASSPNASRLPEPRSSSSGTAWRAGERDELAQLGLLGEPDRPEVRLGDAQQQPGLGRHGRLVVGDARPVRRADLDESRQRDREYLRDPEAVADLDQLAARDDDLSVRGECSQAEQQRGGVVVHDQRVLGAGQAPEDRREMVVARAACSLGEVVFEVRVALRDRASMVECGRSQGRPPEVRVQHHAGRVDDAAQPRLSPAGRPRRSDARPGCPGRDRR